MIQGPNRVMMHAIEAAAQWIFHGRIELLPILSSAEATGGEWGDVD
jgi:hypothetical protein